MCENVKIFKNYSKLIGTTYCILHFQENRINSARGYSRALYVRRSRIDSWIDYAIFFCYKTICLVVIFPHYLIE